MGMIFTIQFKKQQSILRHNQVHLKKNVKIRYFSRNKASTKTVTVKIWQTILAVTMTILSYCKIIILIISITPTPTPIFITMAIIM